MRLIEKEVKMFHYTKILIKAYGCLFILVLAMGCEEKKQPIPTSTDSTEQPSSASTEQVKKEPAETEPAPIIWDGTADTSWYNDSQNEFTISTAEQLAGLAKLVNSGKYVFDGKTFKLERNIMLNDTANWQNWDKKAPANKWIPIGITDSHDKTYFGIFDGNGKTISGVYINSTSDNQGLFGLSGGEIKNLRVTASYIKGGKNVGGMVGNGECSTGIYSTISNCYFTGMVMGTNNVGGLVGYSQIGEIKNSYSNGIVVGKENVGGLIGFNQGGVEILFDGKINNSYSTCAVTGTNNVGGLMGNNNHGNINSSYSIGAVTGTNNVGGLAGISNGIISGNYSTYTDFAGIINNSYSTGKVTGKSNVGGLVGENKESKIANSYYDREASGQSDKGKGEGKSTAEMKNINKIIADFANNINIFASGDGTKEKPYTIITKKQLEDFSHFVNMGMHFSDKQIKLGSDITLNDTTGWKEWASKAPNSNWTPIGSINNPFRGTFDGNNKTISGVYINSTSDNQGLFGCLDVEKKKKNIRVAASYIKGGKFVGGLVGVKYVQTRLEHSESGMVEIKSSGKINNSNYTGDVYGTSDAGKILGGEKHYGQYEQ
jgi:hypothetical protein